MRVGAKTLIFTKTTLGGLAAPLNLPLIHVKEQGSRAWSAKIWLHDHGDWYYEVTGLITHPYHPYAHEFYTDGYCTGKFHSAEAAWQAACSKLFSRRSNSTF